MEKNLWFKAKRYGWGWTPCFFDEWLVIVVFVIFEYWNFVRLDAVSHSNSDTVRPFFVQTFLAVSILLLICFKKGEKPRWRWGKE